MEVQGDPNKTQPKQTFLAEEWKEIDNYDKLPLKASLLEQMLRKFRANRFINTRVKWKHVKRCKSCKKEFLWLNNIWRTSHTKLFLKCSKRSFQVKTCLISLPWVASLQNSVNMALCEIYRMTEEKLYSHRMCWQQCRLNWRQTIQELPNLFAKSYASITMKV